MAKSDLKVQPVASHMRGIDASQIKKLRPDHSKLLLNSLGGVKYRYPPQKTPTQQKTAGQQRCPADYN